MKKKLLISGMTCMHCSMHVQKALKNTDGVADVKVDLKDKSAVIELNKDISEKQLKDIIDDAGYELTGVENIA